MKKTSLALAFAAALLTATAGHPGVARATPYEAFIDVESEDDLYDLLAASQISSETFEILRTLLARGVDLDQADRDELYSLPNLTYDDVDAILAYRKNQGYVGDPVALVAAGAITEDKLLAIASFLIVRSRDRDPNRPRGWVKVFSRGANGDDRVPPVALRARMLVGRHLTAGIAASLTRLRIGAPVWDPNRGGLLADDAATRPHVPKYFVRYRGDHLDMIAGTYRVGFGQRLTFDNSSDYTPNGIYYDDQLSRDDDLARRCRTSTGELSSSPCSDDFHYITSDFRWSEGLRGVAAGTDHVDVGTGYIEAYGWGSYATRSLYQYELVNRAICPDPRDDRNEACSAPPVYVRPDDDPLAPAPVHSYQTLPDVYAEALVGGNITFHARRRDYIGLTAYGATTTWLIDAPDTVKFDTQEWSRVPIGGRYGAIGVNAAIGRGIYDFFAEATRSFDRIPASSTAGSPIDGGGGQAAIVRMTRTVRHKELELSARYYDANFVNPYAGPLAAADEVEGQRARGEHGIRARYTGIHGALTVRSAIDLWRGLATTRVPPPDDPMAPPLMNDTAIEYVPRVNIYARADLKASERLGYGVGVDFQDKDLGLTGSSEECYEIVFDDGNTGEPIACRGTKLTMTARLRFAPSRTMVLSGQVQHSLLDDFRPSHADDGPRQDITALAMLTWRLRPDIRLRGRMRYRNEAIADNQYLEQTLATYVEAAFKLRKKDTLQIRGDLILHLDDRERTLLREPAPELWLGAAYQVNY